MTDRKQFIESMKTQLDNIDEKISEYESKMAEANDRAAKEYGDRLDELKQVRADAADSLEEARDKADSEWSAFRDRAEQHVVEQHGSDLSLDDALQRLGEAGLAGVAGALVVWPLSLQEHRVIALHDERVVGLVGHGPL